MTLSPTVPEWAESYEQEHGHKPTDMALRIVEHINKVGDMLTELGEKDAKEDRPPYPASVFPALVIEAFRLDADKDYEMVEAVADLWHCNYIEAYWKGGVA